MCLSRKHVDYLKRSNEADYRERRISFETFTRFEHIISRCLTCEKSDNGAFGDIVQECRLHFLRLFVSMKRDSEQAIIRPPRSLNAIAHEAAKSK